MKYYEDMVDMGCFSRSELVSRLALKEATAASLLLQYQKKGYIERVRHDLYVAISIENKQPVLSRYEIGSRLFPDASVSHHSAFEVYGYANQVFYEVYVKTNSRFKEFEYGDVVYRRIAPKEPIQIQKAHGVKVTSVEQTVIDSISAVEKIGGLEELIRCLVLIPYLNVDKLLTALATYKNGFLYQKSGFLMEQLNGSLGLSDSFFQECKKHVPKADRYLTKDHSDCVLHRDWRLIGPKDITKKINKGVTDYDEKSQTNSSAGDL